MAQNNPFGDLLPGAGAPQAMPAPVSAPPLRQIMGPQPKQPPAQTPEQARGDILGNLILEDKLKKSAAEQEEAAALAQRQQDGISDALNQMRNVVSQARQAKKKSNDWFATGFGANWAGNIGGTAAADVRSLLNTIGANNAFDRLQKMRSESKTGGALGAVSERELTLLRDSIASIEQSQSDEQFRQNMDLVIDSYQRVIDRLEGRNPDLRDDPRAYGEDALRSQLAGMKDGWIAKFKSRNPRANAEAAWQRVEQDAFRRFNADPRVTRSSGGSRRTTPSSGWGPVEVID